MRLLFVVQRYGMEVAGGAEQACREFATRSAARGHQVEVLTSCAASYVDWANAYPAGTEDLAGVEVHRLPVARPRDHVVFGGLQHRVLIGHKPVPYHLQREWMRQQGPDVPDLPGWLEERAPTFDVVVFFTYLYYTTWSGVPVAARLAPTLLHPTAHDEPPIYLGIFDPVFRHPHAFGFLVEEEAELVDRRFHLRRPSSVLGIGAELDVSGDADRFRRVHGLEDRPYLLFIGRVDPHKGSDELYDQFVAYKARYPGPLALVFLGEPVKPVSPHPDVFVTGFVDEDTRRDAIEGCLALVQPSYFESFSMVLTEAWAHRRPALVQAHSEVLVGQARRSGGALPYRGFAQFEAAVDLLTSEPVLCRRLADSGRRYVERRYQWDDVLNRYDRLLERTATAKPARAG
ncbi:MAG TPA: glycosyltransferase family 4 protein [Acidimicrobiales bacterium]|nr:glycosyltransferase family 4 protein [Acidimicrobiales bacterium]